MFSPSLLTKPFPAETFYLKAKVTYCTASSSTRKDQMARKEKREPSSYSSCCFKKDMAFDQIIKSCRSCPANSVPRLNGFYCESCPPGYEPREGSFGCAPCGIAYFKNTKGNAMCERCPTGKTTSAVGQTHCVSGEGLPPPPPITDKIKPGPETYEKVPTSALQSLIKAVNKSYRKVKELYDKVKELFPNGLKS